MCGRARVELWQYSKCSCKTYFILREIWVELMKQFLWKMSRMKYYIFPFLLVISFYCSQSIDVYCMFFIIDKIYFCFFIFFSFYIICFLFFSYFFLLFIF